MHSLSAEAWLQPVRKAGIKDRDRLGLKHAAWEGSGVRLDVRRTKLHICRRALQWLRNACSSDKPLENNFLFLFSAGKADTECKAEFYNSAKKQSSTKSPLQVLNVQKVENTTC